MTTGGWITMILSVGFVTALFIWCCYKVLTGKPQDHELGHIGPIHADEVDKR